MARGGTANRPERLEPLPPETRTAGQLVAETIRFYREHFWPSLALGISVAAVDAVTVALDGRAAVWAGVGLGSVLLSASFVAASVLVSGIRRPNRTLALAWFGGFLAYLPFPFLALGFVLPAVAWLALIGLIVPVIVVEGTSLRAGFRRAVALARADFVHALGSLSALVLVYVLTRFMLFFLLRGWSGIAERTAGFLADLVLAPVLFLGGALLYFDQAARVVGSRSRDTRRRRRDADLHHALEPDRAGRADAEVEPRPAARGQS